MDDELERAARKQRLTQRQGAFQAQQRKRQEAEQQAALVPAVSSRDASGELSTPSPPAAPPDFKAEVAAKFRELVAGGEQPNEAAIKAVTQVRQARAAVNAAPAQEVSQTLASSSQATYRDVTTREETGVLCPGGPFTCFICVEPKGADQRFLPHKCSVTPEALCCRPCFVAWAESQIDAEAAAVKCCHCDLLLDAHELSAIVDASRFTKYCCGALQRTLKRDTSFIWCSKCPGGGWVDSRQPTSSCGWICPECSNSFVYCPFCRREHGTISCKRFQQLRREIIAGKTANDKVSEDVVQRNSKMCPSCKMPIQKDGGCNFMDCPNCRRHFCWSCGRILKGSHQAHHCDAGFEGSKVISKTPNGQPCVELTRLFTNVLDIDNIELMNTDDVDLADLREMLVPGLSQEGRSPLFVGPSQCDGELLLRLPFNFRKSMNWELTHLMIRATHPPAPNSHPPRSVALLPNVPSAQFSDFDDPCVTVVELQDAGSGVFLVPLEQFRSKGIFKRITSLALRFSVSSPTTQEDVDMHTQVYFNDLALFGIPGESSSSSSHHRNWMMDERANLIVSPVLNRRRWGEEVAENDE